MNLEKLIELIAEQAAREAVAIAPEHLSGAVRQILAALGYVFNKLCGLA